MKEIGFPLSYFISYDGGMGRVFTYQDQAANPLIPDPRFAWKKLGNEDRRFHFMATNDFTTNSNDGIAMLQKYKMEHRYRMAVRISKCTWV